MRSLTTKPYDVVILGGGVSGSFFALQLCHAGMRCLMLEAGSHFTAATYPRTELDGNAQLYWGGGIEFTRDMGIGLIRPKAVGGGSIVNQALMDRFDDTALDGFRETSELDYFTPSALSPYYERAESELTIQQIPAHLWNKNVRIFTEGFEKNGYKWAPLRRAQHDCRYADKNDCILCLNGCRLDSKQSMPVTALKKALAKGLTLISNFEVTRLISENGNVTVEGVHRDGQSETFHAERGVLAAGAIGNSKLLLQSGFGDKNPAIGKGFYTHPQMMVLARYREVVNAHKGPFQAVKSADPTFRKEGFKLENVFTPPVAMAMLLPGMGREHQRMMQQMNHLACIEVAVQDTNPGTIGLSGGRVVIDKKLNREDCRRRDLGLKAIANIFNSTGAEEVISGTLPIGLHLMGGCGIGANAKTSAVDPEFHLRGNRNLFVADSSIFPCAPGQNPSLSIMALSLKASDTLLREAGHAA